MLLDLVSDLLGVDGMLLAVRSGGATAEVRGTGLGARQRGRWITVGENDGPAHLHIDAEAVRSAEFFAEERPGRTSYGARLLDGGGNRVLAAYFTGMYDGSGALVPGKKAAYDALAARYPSPVEF